MQPLRPVFLVKGIIGIVVLYSFGVLKQIVDKVIGPHFRASGHDSDSHMNFNSQGNSQMWWSWMQAPSRTSAQATVRASNAFREWSISCPAFQ